MADGWIPTHGPRALSLNSPILVVFTAVNSASSSKRACSSDRIIHSGGNQKRRGRSCAGWSFHLGRI